MVQLWLHHSLKSICLHISLIVFSTQDRTVGEQRSFILLLISDSRASRFTSLPLQSLSQSKLSNSESEASGSSLSKSPPTVTQFYPFLRGKCVTPQHKRGWLYIAINIRACHPNQSWRWSLRYEEFSTCKSCSYNNPPIPPPREHLWGTYYPSSKGKGGSCPWNDQSTFTFLPIFFHHSSIQPLILTPERLRPTLYRCS